MLQAVKSVLVGLTEEGRDESSSALSYGLSLAREANAHVTALAASVRLVLHDALVSEVAAELIEAENQRLSALCDAVAERVQGDAEAAGVVSTVEALQLSFTDLRDALLLQARVHDLCVLDAEASVTDVDRGLIDAVLFESGRPLVVVPPGQNSFAAGRVLVAWDGSAHAAAALGNALPLLKAADAVEIASVSEEKNWSCLVPGADAARYLARHGVSPTVTSLPIQNRDIAETLRSHATRSGADLMVMGAYKHSRLREWIMGGVTHGLLSECPIPLYMVR